MTTWFKVDENGNRWEPTYHNVLDHGFVGLVDFMGSDAAIAEAARVSYGAGTTKTNKDPGLIRYLVRHYHSSPLEMAETKWHIKCPIFVARQIMRHRTFSINEISGRYSVLDDEMYIPAGDKTSPQSDKNNQGRMDVALDDYDYKAVRTALEIMHDEIYQTYLYLSGPDKKMDRGQAEAPRCIEDAKQQVEAAAVKSIMEARSLRLQRDEEDFTEADVEGIIQKWLTNADINYISDQYPGIARELARIVLPLSTYTQFVWKGDLHNLFHFLRLRADSHAQYEVRVYAEAMLEMIRPLLPSAVSAFEDYRMHARSMSRMEMNVIGAAMRGELDLSDAEAVQAFLTGQGVSGREIREFMEHRTYDHP